MFYKAIGIMSGSSLDGLDIVLAEFTETAGHWTFRIIASDCSPFEKNWIEKLQQAIHLNAFDYLQLHTDFGIYTGEKVNEFIEKHQLQYQVQLIASHGHTTFHAPHSGITGQLGNGADIAAITGINVVSDLRAMDVALGGQGAPIVPMGEKLLWPEYDALLNIGGIANISLKKENQYIAFDICPANRVLNLLANEAGKKYDDGGQIAASGKVNTPLLTTLNSLDYYRKPYPKSLANDFGVHIVYPCIKSCQISLEDGMRTFTEHIAMQTGYAVAANCKHTNAGSKLLITGGGAHNLFLTERIQNVLSAYGIDTVIPERSIVDYKEALIMALLGILRWREENTVMASVTGASRNSIGGAVWMGQQA